MSLLKKLFGGSYEDLWKAVIRPNRDEYSEEELGPEKFEIKGKLFKRTDFSITNKRNLKLQCSFWEPYDEEREYERLPCVVYLHGNSSSRCEAVSEAKYLLPMNITFFAFDFSGCGKSEGEYISLGWYETEDVESVIEYLRKTNKVSTIGLWGRSMGAVTAIMYGVRDPSIAGLVLDSSFASLKVLIEELVKEKVSLPGFVLSQATKLVKSTVNKKANFNLDDIEPIKYAETCFIPALFCHANGDSFVKKHHCEELYAIYPGDKNVIYVEGDHNSARPRFFRDSASIFFYNTLQVAYIKEISDNYADFKFMIKKEDIPQPSNVNNINAVQNDSAEDEEALFQKILEESKKDLEKKGEKIQQNKDVNLIEKVQKKIHGGDEEDKKMFHNMNINKINGDNDDFILFENPNGDEEQEEVKQPTTKKKQDKKDDEFDFNIDEDL
ncbi:MAG: alpha/beta fold hydrolase [archaeon]|nr:alpha/beta fold hydrolase [archaeon]